MKRDGCLPLDKDQIMDIEVVKKLLDRTDALESVVRQLISVLTPEQLAQFKHNTKLNWELADKHVPAEAAETLQRTKSYALKISGISQ